MKNVGTWTSCFRPQLDSGLGLLPPAGLELKKLRSSPVWVFGPDEADETKRREFTSNL